MTTTLMPPVAVDEARPVWTARIVRVIPILIVLLFGFTLRMNEFFQPYIDDFSWRQASTAMMADTFYRDSRNIFFPAVRWNGPELSYQGREFQTVTYLAALLYEVLGQKDWVGRGISIGFAMWGIVALYLLVRRVWDEPRALATALIYAVMPGAVFIDRSFLPDGAMLALTVTTAWLYVAYLQTLRWPYLVGAGVVGVLAYLTKLPGTISLAALIYATITILRQRGQLHWPYLRPIIITLGIMIVPIAGYYGWAVYLGKNYPPYHIAGADNWVWDLGLRAWLREGYYLPGIWDHLWRWLWTPPVLGLVILGLLTGPGRATDADAAREPVARAPWFFHFWFLGGLMLLAIGAREVRVNPWNLHAFNVFAAAMAGQGLVVIASYAAAHRPRWEAVVRVMIVLGVVLWGTMLGLKQKYGPVKVASWKMGQALERVSEPGDLVVTIPDDIGDPIAIYYSHRRGFLFPPTHLPDVWPLWNYLPPTQEGITLFEDLRGQGAKWLGIVNKPQDDLDDPVQRNFWASHQGMAEHIKRTCELIEKNDFYVLYRIKSQEELKAETSPPVE